MLPPRIHSFLNAGDAVVAEVPSGAGATQHFIRIRPTPKPGVPREERRYLNSTWSMWEYWDFSFRRLTLRKGWGQDEWNYDRYIVEDEMKLTVDATDFERLLADWVPSTAVFKHISESEFPE